MNQKKPKTSHKENKATKSFSPKKPEDWDDFFALAHSTDENKDFLIDRNDVPT